MRVTMRPHHNVAMPRNGACDKSTDGRTDGLTTEASSRRIKNSSYVTRGRAYRISAIRYALPAAAALLAVACDTPSGSGPSAPVTPTVAPSTASAAPPALNQVRDPGQVTGTLTGPCHTSDSGQLPDPRCTPGAYDPAVTAAVLCAPGYTTRAYRAPEAQTSAFKWNVAEPAYGQVNVSGELDHLVSLELGGANDASNLWVEPGPIPNAKDAVENQLHAWVCQAAGAQAEQRLHDAQVAIASNWTTALATLHVGAGPALSGSGG